MARDPSATVTWDLLNFRSGRVGTLPGNGPSPVSSERENAFNQLTASFPENSVMSDDTDTKKEQKIHKPHSGSGSLGIFGLVSRSINSLYLCKLLPRTESFEIKILWICT